jgi:hypothetical protein
MLALVAMPAVAHAQGEARAPSPPQVEAGPPASRTVVGENAIERFDVATTIDEAAPDGCRYQGTVRGQLQQVQPRLSPDAPAGSLLPDLRIQATLRCPGAAAVSIRERRLQQPQPTRADLEKAIRMMAELNVVRAGRTCHYAPEVVLRERVLEPGPLRTACQYAYGGGPR